MEQKQEEEEEEIRQFANAKKVKRCSINLSSIEMILTFYTDRPLN